MQKFLKNKLVIVYFSFWFLYFLYFWINSITTNSSGDILVANTNMWGDWAAHFTFGSAMSERSLILKKSPLLLGSNFAYPFVSDLISAILIRLNFNFFQSFVLPSFIFSLTLIFSLFYFYKTISKSKVIAVVASLIFLLSGGTGFLYYFNDIKTSDQPMQTIINPPRKYTDIQKKHYVWMSIIDSMVIPQRSLGLGLSLSLISLTIIYQELISKKKKKRILTKKLTKLLTAGLIIGFMPIIHTHSFLALFIILFFWMIADLTQKSKTIKKNIYKKIIPWLFMVLIISTISLPLIHEFFLSNLENSFIKWFPGWYLNTFKDETLITFWFKNWGITPLISALGLALVIKKSKQKLKTFFIYLPFFIIFIILNLFLFQPFIWDNTKLLIWASLGVSLLSAILLKALWINKKLKIFGKILTIFIFILMTFSATIDTYRISKLDLNSNVMYSKEELEIADWVKNNTDKNSIWLTGNYHNNWLFNLTGRQALMTYPGWLWTHGYNYSSIEKDYKILFAHPENEKLIKKYNLNYVVLGPFEKKELKTNYLKFARYHQLIKKTENISVFKFIPSQQQQL